MSNIIQNIIESGLNLMNSSITQSQYDLWIARSKSAILRDRRNFYVYMKYIELVHKVDEMGISYGERIGKCLYFLIRVQPILDNK